MQRAMGANMSRVPDGMLNANLEDCLVVQLDACD